MGSFVKCRSDVVTLLVQLVESSFEGRVVLFIVLNWAVPSAFIFPNFAFVVVNDAYNEEGE